MSTFGKALANGFALSALLGKAELMEASGIYHDRQRVFALSTTHGAETHALAAGIATMRFYQQNPVIEALDRQGTRLANGINRAIQEQDVTGHVQVIGKPCNLVFATRDREGNPSQGFRALLMQELIRRGVLGPSLVVSYSHSDHDVDQTIEAFRGALGVYRQALDQGYEEFLVGPETQVVYRDFNAPAYSRMSLT
jgi:glutamate-1-semialdehyde 2,1-aminomutase